MANPPSVAVIDIGSNTIKLLVAARTKAGNLTALKYRTIDARISAGISQATPRLAEEGMAGRALFTGMVTGADKLALFADADLFALPSHSENFGISVVEALACGVPVLISDHVNLWREVEAAGCGRIEPVDVGAVSAALSSLLADPGALRTMGQRGRTLVANRFTWPRVADALDRLYKRIAAPRGKKT